MKTIYFIFIVSLFFILSCSGETGHYPPEDAATDSSDISDTNDIHDITDIKDVTDTVETPVCGNGKIEGDEVCDDGNTVSGDGCNSSCRVNDGLDRVANGRTPGDQTDPLLLFNSSQDATFVLLYTDWGSSDGGNAGIRLRYFSADGTPGEDIIVNTVATADNQHSARGAIDNDGRVFIVWVSELSAGAITPGIRAAILDLNGNVLTPEFRVDTDSSGTDLSPFVSFSDTRWFVTWTDSSGTGGADLKGRFFDKSGIPVANSITSTDDEFLLPVAVAGMQLSASTVSVNNTSWLVVYEDYSATYDSSASGISWNYLDSTGLSFSNGIINGITTGKQSYPFISMAGTVLSSCWIDNSGVNDFWEWGTHCRVFDASMTPYTDDFPATQTTLSSQINPAVVSDTSGFTVFWEDWSAVDGNGAGIRGRRFDYGGNPISDEISVNTTYLNHQKMPTVIKVGELYFIAWQDESASEPDDSGTSIRMRVLRQDVFTSGK